MQKSRKGIFNLQSAFLDFQKEMAQNLKTTRGHIKHPGKKGDASELKWIETLKKYLPKRYSVDKAFVIDYRGNLSEEIDMVIYDRQYSPFLFVQSGSLFIPSESVYAVFEIKQSINKKYLEYAGRKAASVRKLLRTSVPIPYVEGVYKKKRLSEIIAGVLSLDSNWKKPFDKPFRLIIEKLTQNEHIDIGCVLRYGAFEIKYKSKGTPEYEFGTKDNGLIFFFLKLFSRLRSLATCPAIDIEKYGKSIFKASKVDNRDRA